MTTPEVSDPQYDQYIEDLAAKEEFFVPSEKFHCPNCDRSRLVCPECWEQGVGTMCTCTMFRLEKSCWSIEGQR